MTFNPAKDIPDLTGKVFLITGGTAGLGKQTLLELAKHNPGHLYFTGRNQKSAAEIISQLKTQAPAVPVTFLECDLGSQVSIRDALKNFTSDRLDVYIANAGIMATPPKLTKDGHEEQFGINHVGHFALLKLLLPTLLRTAEMPGSDVRVLSLSSLGHGMHPRGGIQIDTLKTTQEKLGGLQRYGQAKLANILMVRELTRRHPSITSMAIHPGVVQTDLVHNLGFWNRLLVYVTTYPIMTPPEEGAYNQLWAATAKKEDLKSGEFYTPVGKRAKPMRQGTNDELAEKLWEWSEKETADLQPL